MKGERAASQWDLYAESHSCFESLPKIMFQRACITLPKSSWWMAVSLNLDAEWGSSSEQSSSRLFTQSKQDGTRAFCNQHLLKISYLALFYSKVTQSEGREELNLEGGWQGKFRAIQCQACLTIWEFPVVRHSKTREGNADGLFWNMHTSGSWFCNTGAHSFLPGI